MGDDLWLWAWGAAGALMLAGGALGLKLCADLMADTAGDKRRIRLALLNAALSIMTGAVIAQAFAGVAQDWANYLVHLSRTAAALIVGCSANFLWPKIVRRLGDAADKGDIPHTGETP